MYEVRKRIIQLIDIDPDNWRSGLEVAQSQKRYVANSAVMLARAYRMQRSRAFLICADETPVGMGLYYDLPDMECYDFSQFFIDERYQGRGYGKEAVKMLFNAMKADGRYHKVVLCYIEGNEVANSKLYESFEFAETDRDGDEIAMELFNKRRDEIMISGKRTAAGAVVLFDRTHGRGGKQGQSSLPINSKIRRTEA